MKKALSIFVLCAVMLCFLCGCQNGEKPSDDSSISLGSTQTEKSKAPSDEVAKELFEKSSQMQARSFYSERDFWVPNDLGDIFIDTKTNYDAQGNVQGDWPGDGSRLYWKSTYKYEDAKAYYAKVFSGELLERFMIVNFCDFDGVLGVAYGGGASGFSYEDLKLTYKGYKGGVHLYDASYLLWESERHTDFGIEVVDGEYRVCINEYYSGPYGWDREYYRIPPAEQDVRELFDRSVKYLARTYLGEMYVCVVEDLEGIVIDTERFFHFNGTEITDLEKWKAGEQVLYWKTDYDILKAREFYAKTFTGEALDEFMAANFYDFDGKLGVKACATSRKISCTDLTLTYDQLTDSIHRYIAKYKLVYDNGKVIDSEYSQTEFAIDATKEGPRVYLNDFDKVMEKFSQYN